MKDEFVYTAIYQDFAINLHEILKEKNDQYVYSCFDSPAIFDGVINILVRELKSNIIKNYLLHKYSRIKIMT